MKTEFYVADRKVAEQSVQESEQRYHRLLASTADYTYTVTVDRGRSLATSHGPGCEAVTGYTSRELSADPLLWSRMICEEDRPAVLTQVARILKGEVPPPLEHRIVHKDGNTRWILNTPIPHMDNQGDVVAYDGHISDITDRKQAEDQLKRAYAELAQSEATLKFTLQELKASHEELKATELQLIQAAKLESIGTLAAGVAHEVKNPLQTMLMGLHYLAHNLAPASEGIALALGDMRDAVQRANSIIQNLSQLSAATEFEAKVGDLNTLIERSLGLVQSELIASQITVARKLATDLPSIQMDGAKMQQVFINLFINALQAMPQGGDLTVATRAVRLGQDLARHERIFRQFKPADTLVVAEVQDTGTGILESHFAKLFDPFFTTKPVGVGTGLGLSVSKRIVDLHGGAIDIRNAPGRGVVVTLVLKATKEERPWIKNAS